MHPELSLHRVQSPQQLQLLSLGLVVAGMPPFNIISLPPGIMPYYWWKQCAPYKVEDVSYNFRLYSTAYEDEPQLLHPNPRTNAARPMLAHTFRFRGGGSRRLDLHRVVALNL